MKVNVCMLCVYTVISDVDARGKKMIRDVSSVP